MRRGRSGVAVRVLSAMTFPSSRVGVAGSGSCAESAWAFAVRLAVRVGVERSSRRRRSCVIYADIHKTPTATPGNSYDDETSTATPTRTKTSTRRPRGLRQLPVRYGRPGHRGKVNADSHPYRYAHRRPRRKCKVGSNGVNSVRCNRDCIRLASTQSQQRLTRISGRSTEMCPIRSAWCELPRPASRTDALNAGRTGTFAVPKAR